MSRIPTQRKLRFILLRCSSLPLASILLSAMAVVFVSYRSDRAEPWWLLSLSGLLSAALVTVLLRVGPVMWRDLTHYRRLRRVSSIHSMHNHAAWRINKSPYILAERCHAVLEQQRYRIRQGRQDGMILISAMKGGLDRLGFILVHAAMILILLGTLMDSDLWLRYQLASGRLRAETHTLPLNEMIGAGRLGSRSRIAFQGTGLLHVGQITDEVKVDTRWGVLARQLPFAVTVNAVELDANQTLQENNFLTRLAILDPQRDQPVTAVLGVNQPFHYRGLDYYQQAIIDGGSELTVSMWPLAHAQSTPLKFRSRVGAERRLQTRQGTINIVFSDLKPRNVMAMQENIKKAAEYKSIGPSLYYRVRDQDFREREYINYMLPVLQDGRYFYISGIRDDSAEPFRFLHLPVDRDGGLDLFFALHAALFDQARIDKAVNKVLADAGRTAMTTERNELRRTLLEQVSLFRQGGLAAINKNVTERVAKANIAQSLQLTHKLVRSLLYALFVELEQGPAGSPPTETDVLFFEDAMPALAGMAEVAMPFYIQLQDMLYKPAVSLLISYKPGASLFFTGWSVLLFGLLAGFSAYHRRLWVLFRTEDDLTTVTVAGMGNRQGHAFAREFNQLSARLQIALHAC